MGMVGQWVDDTVPAGSVSPGSVASQLLLALRSVPAVQVAPAGANSYRLTRRSRPRWAMWCACMTAPTLVGLFFLLVKQEESCLVTISQRPGGTVVRLCGTLDPVTRQVLLDGLPGPRLLAAPTFVPGVAAVQPEKVATANQRPGATKVRPQWQLRLGSEQAILIDGTILVGRDPAAPPGEHAHGLVPVEDPTRSVSKTHFALGPQGQGVWVMDRFSTNGTAVVSGSGRRLDCPPGQRVEVTPPCTVLFGDLQATLLAAQVNS